MTATVTEIPISPDIWDTARRVCTDKQLVVLELRDRYGFSWNQIAIHENVTRSAVKERYYGGARNVAKARNGMNGNEASV